jgi:hypothetical protein
VIVLRVAQRSREDAEAAADRCPLAEERLPAESDSWLDVAIRSWHKSVGNPRIAREDHTTRCVGEPRALLPWDKDRPATSHGSRRGIRIPPHDKIHSEIWPQLILVLRIETELPAFDADDLAGALCELIDISKQKVGEAEAGISIRELQNGHARIVSRLLCKLPVDIDTERHGMVLTELTCYGLGQAIGPVVFVFELRGVCIEAVCNAELFNIAAIRRIDNIDDFRPAEGISLIVSDCASRIHMFACPG